MSEPGHEDAKPLKELVAEWPDLRVVMKALRPNYVFVQRYLRTIPKMPRSIDYRTDAYVNGLYVVDVAAVKAGRAPQIEQDYLVQWRHPRNPEVSYFSGIPKRYRSVRPEIWIDIALFCKEFGHDGQYACPDVTHHYSDESDPCLPQEPPWPDAFRRAMAEARRRAGATAS